MRFDNLRFFQQRLIGFDFAQDQVKTPVVAEIEDEKLIDCMEKNYYIFPNLARRLKCKPPR